MNFNITLNVCVLILLMQIGLHSQPDWVQKIFHQEIQPQKTEAAVLVLHQSQKVEVFDNKTAIKTIRQAYKILNVDGLEYATISLPISAKIEVTDLDGWWQNAEGEIFDLTDEDIIEIGFQQSAAYQDEYSNIFADFPEAIPGDLIAFEVVIEENDWTSLFQTYTFQIQQPVLYTSFEISIPLGWEIMQAEWNLDEIKYTKRENGYFWESHNLKYRKSEPLQPPWDYLEKKISLVVFNPDERSPTKFSSWENVANWCANIFKEPALPSDEIKEMTKTVIAEAKTFEDKINSIANYVQNGIRYVAIEIGKERWHPRAAQITYQNRYGDCKDMSTLMRAMLSSLNIKTVPVILNTATYVDWRIPTPFQFNHCIIGISMEGLKSSPNFQNAVVEDWLFFDPPIHIFRLDNCQLPCTEKRLF